MRTRQSKKSPLAFILIFSVVLAACAGSPGTGADQAVTVAIWDLEALGPMDAAQTAMGELLSSQIIARFEASRRYLPVERSRLLNVMEELNLGSSELSDHQTRLKLGRLVGARQMVFGAYQFIGNTVRLDIRLVDVASGRIMKVGVGTKAADAISEWMDAADQAADELLK